MTDCYFNLNGEMHSSFVYDGVRATAFSGNGPDRNNPGSGAVARNGPIPPGSYWIVDRASGGTLGGLRDLISHRDQWFALYRDDGSIDDETFYDGVRRGEFRLHPIGPLRMSIGCIVLEYATEFDALRTYLKAQPLQLIPGTATRTYGLVAVGQVILDDRVQPRGPRSATA